MIDSFVDEDELRELDKERVEIHHWATPSVRERVRSIFGKMVKAVGNGLIDFGSAKMHQYHPYIRPSGYSRLTKK